MAYRSSVSLKRHDSERVTMSEQAVIEIVGVSKKFCKSLKRSMIYGVEDITREALGIGSSKDGLRRDEFWAIDNVSLELKKGESLGLMGPNGSGKSTLLKLINGIFLPDRVNITVRGKVGALIEIGAGFHPLLTGRENVYVNGLILGMAKSEIGKKFDEIVEFADVGDFIDTPVKYYSSGMFVRLGFAIAIHSRPDILLVDEVLAVGDSDFQTKCMNAIEKIKERGTSIVLVSHNEVLIERNTTKALLLIRGKQSYFSDTNEVLRKYSEFNQEFDKRNDIFVDKNHILHIVLLNNPSNLINSVFVAFVYRNNSKVCSLIKEISENDIIDNKIKLYFDLSILSDGWYFLTYRLRDKRKHNKIIQLVQNNWFEIKNNYTNKYIGKYESSGIVLEGLGDFFESPSGE